MNELTKLNVRKWEFQIFVIVGAALLAGFFSLNVSIQKSGARVDSGLDRALWAYERGLEKTESEFLSNGILGPWSLQGFHIPDISQLPVENSELLMQYQISGQKKLSKTINNYSEMQAAYSLADLSNAQILDFLDYQLPHNSGNANLTALTQSISDLPLLISLPEWQGGLDGINASLVEAAENYGRVSYLHSTPDKGKFINFLNDHIADIQNALDAKEDFLASRAELQDWFKNAAKITSQSKRHEQNRYESKANFAKNFAHVLMVMLVFGVFWLAKPKFFLTPYEWQKREMLLENISRHEASVNHILTAADKTFSETQNEAHALNEVLAISKKINRKLYRLEKEYQYFKKEEVQDLCLVRQNMERLLHLGGVEVHKEDLAHIMKDFHNVESHFEKHSHRAERDVKDLDLLLIQFKDDMAQLESSVQRLVKSTYFLKRETSVMKDVEGIMRNG